MKEMVDNSEKMITIGLGGGCHWCTEAIYASLLGVESVKQGWISAPAPDENFSEAVLIEFDEQHISLHDVIEIHLYTHSVTSNHAMREKYRSAIYAKTENEKRQIEMLLNKLQKAFSKPLVTRALMFKEFKQSGGEYLNYYYKNPDKPFCQSYIQPKLKMLLEKHPKAVDRSKLSTLSAPTPNT